MGTKRIYGIDLGTTYSCVAYVDEHAKPVVVSNSEGMPTTPSVVYFESADNIVVGTPAKEVAELHAQRVVSTVKRVMGDPNWIFENNGKVYRPQDISSFILRKLVEDAQVATGDTITDVVITCPAYFGVTEKEATRQAGLLAGLNVRYIIPEPTAAAIAYGIGQEEQQVILVYDLGGGTFDITLMEVKSSGITVICTGGDHQLGGKDWDETIATWFAQQFSTKAGIPAEKLTSDPETWQELLNMAERAKIALSSRTSHTDKVRFEAERVVVELTRDKFNELTTHLLERTLSLTDELIATARSKGYEKIDKLLLVGGSTYMPQVMSAVKARFPFEVRQFDPNQAVAKGAAIFGFKCYLDEQVKDRIAEKTGKASAQVDVDRVDEAIRAKAEQEVAQAHRLAGPSARALMRYTVRITASKSFGLIIIDFGTKTEKVNNLIVVHELVPRTLSRRYFTVEDDQTSVLLRCMENTVAVGPEKTLPLDTSKEVGRTELCFTRPLPKNSPLEVEFALAADGLLSVHGKDLTTHQEVRASFETKAIYRSEEIEEMRSRNLAIAVS